MATDPTPQPLTGDALLTVAVGLAHWRLNRSHSNLGRPLPACPSCNTIAVELITSPRSLLLGDHSQLLNFQPCGHQFTVTAEDAYEADRQAEQMVDNEEKRPTSNPRPISGCVFCRIIRHDAPATVVDLWDNAIAIVPRDPVTPGHILVIPTRHVANAAEDPDVTAAVMRRAAEYASAQMEPCNIITSIGPEATQSVMHLHVHVVPRTADDGLHLPWTGQQKQAGR
jgi:histidine triad (HIT) family protein